MGFVQSEYSIENRVFLDYPLDILLNRDCRLMDYDRNVRNLLYTFASHQKPPKPEFQGSIGGLVLPEKNNPGTGNILIQGRPGTGKSILALQIAIASTIFPNNFFSLFFSLEEHAEAVLQRCNKLGWEDKVRHVKFLNPLNDSYSPEEMGRSLEQLITQPEDCPTINPVKASSHEHIRHQNISSGVLLPALSPRSVAIQGSSQRNLFFERLRQIEKILSGAKWLRTQNADHPQESLPDIRLVCIDSLTAFGDGMLSREELYQVFDLFRRYEVIGVFTSEEPTGSGDHDSIDIMEYLSDVVIRLREEEENGYALRFFEIKKSRYQHEIYGRHPLRLQAPGEREMKIIKAMNQERHPYFFQAMRIMPSIHHIVAATEGRGETVRTQESFDIGVCALKNILKRDLRRGSVITIKGPLNSFKTTLARFFLLSGLCKFNATTNTFEGKESILFIRMHDRISFDPENGRFWKVSSELGVHPTNGKPINLFDHRVKDGFIQKFHRLEEESSTKLIKKVWAYATTVEQANDIGKCIKYSPRLIEVAFKSGALLPEEFLEVVRNVINEQSDSTYPTRKISRVVLSDVGLIGASYPFLRKSSTAGSLFLPAFVHVMRNYNIELVMTGTTGQLKEADEAVDLACELADSILHCGFVDVFGDRYVIVRGEGQTASHSSRMSSEFLPGVLISKDAETFEVDVNLLQGLVGFDTGTIHRPGLTLQLFNEGDIHSQYNDEIEMMMRSAFSVPRELAAKERSTNDSPSIIGDGSADLESKTAEVPAHSSDSIGTAKSDTRYSQRTGSLIEDRRRVSIIRFTSDLSEAVHDSLGVLEGRPIDRTMICSIDEFFMAKEKSGKEERGLIDVSRIVDKEKTQEDAEKERDKYLVSIGTGRVYGVPYYANVLLLAYRDDILKDNGITHIPRTWSEWSTLITGEMNIPKPMRRFDFDMIAQETLTCIFLDALISGYGYPKRSNWKFPKEDIRTTRQKVLQKWDEKRGQQVSNILTQGIPEKKKKSAERELIALQELFFHSLKYDLRENIHLNKKEENRYLHGNSILYACWYSQLRDLIGRHPELAPKLRVAPLPGGGFRGDFFLGIIKGSVSETLGRKVIELLFNEQEEYKRFVRGVGLPVTTRFYAKKESTSSGFLAWPSSKERLNKILRIHRDALTRSRIDGYRDYRPALHAMSEMIAFADRKDGKKTIQDCIRRLQYIIRILSTK
jgi:KaiC/GvpD/RAD55 family RecA-like ATPase